MTEGAEEATAATCANCAWSGVDRLDDPVCRRHPPTSDGWPFIVPRQDWCGEWRWHGNNPFDAE